MNLGLPILMMQKSWIKKPMDEAIRQAVVRGDEELIPANVSDSDLQDEMNARSCRAGLTNRQGECVRSTGKIMVQGFGESKLNVWPRDTNGQLIEDE